MDTWGDPLCAADIAVLMSVCRTIEPKHSGSEESHYGTRAYYPAFLARRRLVRRLAVHYRLSAAQFLDGAAGPGHVAIFYRRTRRVAGLAGMSPDWGAVDGPASVPLGRPICADFCCASADPSLR